MGLCHRHGDRLGEGGGAGERLRGGRRIGPRAGFRSSHGAGKGPGADRGHGRGQHHPAFAGRDGVRRARDGRVRFATPEEWCEYYGVEVDNGVAILYKAVDQDFNSYHGTLLPAGHGALRCRIGTAASGSAAAGCTSPRGRRSRSRARTTRCASSPARCAWRTWWCIRRATIPTRSRRGECADPSTRSTRTALRWIRSLGPQHSHVQHLGPEGLRRAAVRVDHLVLDRPGSAPRPGRPPSGDGRKPLAHVPLTSKVCGSPGSSGSRLRSMAGLRRPR